MNDRVGFLFVEVNQSFKDFSAPPLYNLKPDVFDLLDVFPETASADHLSDKYHLVFLFVDPGRDEVNDVLMLEFLD